MTVEEKIAELTNDVTQLKTEGRYNETLIIRTETVISELAEMAGDLKSRQDVHDERMIRLLEEIRTQQNDMTTLRQDQLDASQAMRSLLQDYDRRQGSAVRELQDRVQALENLRWVLYGIGGAVAFIIAKLDAFHKLFS